MPHTAIFRSRGLRWTKSRAPIASTLATVALIVISAQLLSNAQTPHNPSKRFSFQLVQSFNAKYLGDSPGHLGRGSLEGAQPDVSIGDSVFRGNVKIGSVTSVTWDRNKDSLEIEFDPEPYELDPQGHPLRPLRIAVGQRFWIPYGGHSEPASER